MAKNISTLLEVNSGVKYYGLHFTDDRDVKYICNAENSINLTRYKGRREKDSSKERTRGLNLESRRSFTFVFEVVDLERFT